MTLSVDDNTVPFLPTAVQFSAYCLQDEKYAQTFLDILFDEQQSLPDLIEKYLPIIKSYITGGQPWDEFCQQIKKYNNSIVCGHVWTNAAVSYRCRTCAMNPCMSLCVDCFHGGNHDGHDANMFRSVGGGICDCGDVTVMNSNGFCKQHGPNRIPNQPIPSTLIRSAQIVLPRLILRLVQHLRSHASSLKTESDSYTSIEEFHSLTSLFDLFDSLCENGSTIRSILIDSLLNTESYKPNDIYLKQLHATSSLSIPLSLRSDSLSIDFEIKQANCLLDELLFWLIKYEIPERLLKILLMLLTNSNFKEIFSRSFLNVYPMAIQQSIDSRQRMHTYRLVHISVQLFSNQDITIRAIKEFHLFEIILSALFAIFSNILTNCQLENSRENYHLTISETDFSKKMHYWSIVSDLVNILSHEYASRIFLSEKRFLITWIQILNWFQGMNVNQHEMPSDMLLPSDSSYLFAFTVETEYCAMALWTIIAHIDKPNFREITMKSINRLLMTIKHWLSAIGFERYSTISKLNQNQMTYHLPLHRYLSILTYISLNFQNNQLKTIFSIDNEQFLLNLMIHPLRIQVVKYEILTSTIWSFFGHEMQIQSNMYSTTRGNICSYMNDADIYLLQIISNLVNVNKFMQIFFQSFNITNWLVQNKDVTLNLDKSNYIILLEGSLIVLASIIAFSPHIALNDFEYRRAEIISALAIQNCAYSYLDEHIAESKGLSTRKHEIQSILNDIAEYISPTIELSNGIKQGQYKLKDFVWDEEFDPLHVLTRITRRDLFETTMQRYSNWAKMTNKFPDTKNFWPPYRLHKPKDQFQTNIRCLLQSRYLHGVFFSICYWMINETVIQEDILSLLIYLCELAIDDQYLRMKYGFASTVNEPPQCQNNSGIEKSISLETLTSLEDENIDEDEQHSTQIDIQQPTDSYSHRIVKFNEISQTEQDIQKRWDDLIINKNQSFDHQMSYSMPSYDLENQFIRSELEQAQNNHSIEEDKPIESNEGETLNGIIDGKYETFYDHDDFLLNAHTLIEKISFERTILDVDNDMNKQKSKENPINCSAINEMDLISTNLNTASVQTNSKIIIESKSINMSFVQMLVHLLAKIISNLNETNEKPISLNQLLDSARMKKGSERIGDGTVYLTGLLVKLERLCEHCKTQINETVNQFEQNQTKNNMNKKGKAKAMHKKIFEQIAQNQQTVLWSSNEEVDDERDPTIDDQNRSIECCICLNKDDQSPLGLVVRFVDTGVLGVRQIIDDPDNHILSVTSNTNEDQSPLEELFTCCQHDSKQNPTTNKEYQYVYYIKQKDSNQLTCAQFYEEKLRSMLSIYSEENISKSISIHWRTGLIIHSCSHFMHLSCYKQYLKSHLKRSYSDTDPYLEFKCPMCRQTSNGLIPIPTDNLSLNESSENPIETIMNLFSKNSKPCIPSPMTEWLVDFIQKMYYTMNGNHRTIDYEDKELNDNRMALFLVSILRFNLENDLLIRDTEHLRTRLSNRKIPFRELFYLCTLKYPYLLNKTPHSLWQRITGVTEYPEENQSVPLLLCDSVVLLLDILLSLPYLIDRNRYQVIVQALFNLTYIQSLFTIVLDMTKNEQEIWSQISENMNSDSKNMPNYLRIISLKLLRTNFNSAQTKVHSLESIHQLIRERCSHFIKIAVIVQHYLYQPIDWWPSGHVLQADFIWKNLIKELQLNNLGEPYWFCTNSSDLIEKWLDEILNSNENELQIIQKIARVIPLFHKPEFIDLPLQYSDLFRFCIQIPCSYCRKSLVDPLICLICGIIYSQKCCEQQINHSKKHLMICSGGLNISININSTKTLIQREKRYTYWSSIYLDEHGEEDVNLRRGRNLYLNSNRSKLLYSSWISSHLDQLIPRWSIEPYDF